MGKSFNGFVWCFMAVLLFTLSGCGEGNSAGTGTLRVSITDAPAEGFDEVNVTVSKVRVHQSPSASEHDGGWSEIVLDPPKKINLLSLTNGALDTLGQTSLPAGHYTQLRLVLSANTGTTIANSVVLSGETTEQELFTPSAIQSGIKLINEFDVAPGQHVDLVLDFDALKSVVSRGNGSYGLKPVIKVLPMLLTGIDGFVDPALLGSNVIVSAQVNGAEVRSTVPDPVTGEFFLSHLAPGTYDVVITADNHATAVISGVPVLAATGAEGATITSTQAQPISLPASLMSTISGTVTLSPDNADTVAFIDATQTVAEGVTVTVQSRGADMLSGAYAMSLPVDAPLLGFYGTGTLPVVLSAQGGAAGQYAIEASASGYTSQIADENISAGDVIRNFILAP